jgi:hypothetical protein
MLKKRCGLRFSTPLDDETQDAGVAAGCMQYQPP